MGRHNHENSVAIPGYRDNVVLSTDDTFFTIPVTTTNPPQSLPTTRRRGHSSTCTSPTTRTTSGRTRATCGHSSRTRPAIDDYYDFTPGDATKITGHFIEVPKNIAKGKHSTRERDLLSTDFPGMRRRRRREERSSPRRSDGPQWVLDHWGNAANNTQGENVFRFVRLEDVAYDKRHSKSNIVYLVGPGEPRHPAGRLAARGPPLGT